MKVSRYVVLDTLQTLIAGWDELECYRVFNFLCDLTNLLQKIEAVITGKPGVFLYNMIRYDMIQLYCQFYTEIHFQSSVSINGID